MQSLNSQPSSAGATLFPHFPELPEDLRRIIWGISLPGERTIEINLEVLRARVRSLSTRNPAALFVNQESRSEALRYYKLLVRPVDTLPEPTGYFDIGRKRLYHYGNSTFLYGDWIYFNPTIDCISIYPSGPSNLFYSFYSLYYLMIHIQEQNRDKFAPGLIKPEKFAGNLFAVQRLRIRGFWRTRGWMSPERLSGCHWKSFENLRQLQLSTGTLAEFTQQELGTPDLSLKEAQTIMEQNIKKEFKDRDVPFEVTILDWE